MERKRKARANFVDFIQYIKNDYDMTTFHKALATDLGDFYSHKKTENSKNKMIFVPPQHGKSEQSSRLGPAFLLGQNPKLKIAILSYSSVIAQGFSTDIQKYIEKEEYRQLFPNVIIDGVGCKRGTYKRNSYEFHTSEGGYVISVGAGGPLTSKTVDIAIIDDLYKSPVEAWSETHRKKIEDWYWSVLESRLHNDSKIILLYTRWHYQDLAGNLLKSEPQNWEQIVYELVKTGKINNVKDNRNIGDALWPEKHSLKKALRWKERDPVSFESLGQQNPKPIEGFLYSSGFGTYPLSFTKTLEELGKVKSYTDTADTGSDFLANIIFWEYEGKAYIKDLLYTQESMDDTIGMWAEKQAKNAVIEATIEYNNGGHAFALFAKDKLEKIWGYKQCDVTGFHQTQNKEARIFAWAMWVQQNIVWPEGWELRWKEAHDHLMTFMRKGKNLHDDIEDAITGVGEMIQEVPYGPQLREVDNADEYDENDD